MSIIEVKGLGKEFTYYEKGLGLKSSFENLFARKYLTKKAVNDISFEIEQGEVVGFLGPNGAGKTTTLKMLSGILFPTEGECSVMGYVPWERKKEFKKKFSIVMGQKSQLWWDLPAQETFYLNKSIYELDDREYQKVSGELIELLDVKDLVNVQVRRLSLGERMKMELIASLIHSPKVIFLDEPTIGLDIISQKRIREFLKYYKEEKHATIILTSHYMEDIEDLCQRTIVINQGTVVYDGKLNSVNDIFGNHKILKLQFAQPVEAEQLAAYGTIKEWNENTVMLEVAKEKLQQISAKILSECEITDFTVEDIPLEQGIELLYQKKGDKSETVHEI